MHLICRFVLLCAIVGWAASSGCSLFQKVEKPVVAVVKNCADQVTHAATLGILDDVSAALVCDAGNLADLPACVISELGAVALKAGWAAVDCAIAEVQKKAPQNAELSGDSTEFLRARRANAAAAWRAGGGPDGGSGTAPAGAP